MAGSRRKRGEVEGVENQPGMRLDAFLARAGLASRREARGLIKSGCVEIDGIVCRDASRHVSLEQVTLANEVVESPEASRDFLLHKPVGYVCSNDEREAPLIGELIGERLRRRGLRIAGRLDRATSGLLILTTDGDLVHRLTHPNRKLTKRYQIEFEGELVPDAVRLCEAGFELVGDERPTRPAELVLGAPGKATLTLREGRTHQVRRMIRALGGYVIALHRDRIGSFELPVELDVGALRPLAPEERALLLSESSL